MSRLHVYNARIVTPDQVWENATLVAEDGKIVAILDGGASASHPDDVDARGLTLLPGFVDVHVHGGGGGDAMDATPDALRAVCRLHARHGTTSLLATTMTQSGPAISAALRNAREAINAGDTFCPDGARFVGIHLEGPYISAKRPGAQPVTHVRPYDADEFAGWLDDAGGHLKLITLAPEEPGADALIDVCRERGIVVSMGHTDVTAEQATDALRRGAAHATHLFNAMPSVHHRSPGPIPVLLTDKRACVEIIADGHHVAPVVCALIWAAKPANRVIAITDAIAGAGVGDGQYQLGGCDITVKDGRATLADGTLAGSVLTMNRAARNLRDWCGLDWADVARVSSTNAADQLGLPHKGRIAPNADADFVLVDDDLNVHATYIGGRPVFSAE